jgi:hypothetical protein
MSEFSTETPSEEYDPTALGDLVASADKPSEPLAVVELEDVRKAKPKRKPKPVSLGLREVVFVVSIVLATLIIAAVVLFFLPIKVVFQTENQPTPSAVSIVTVPASAGNVPLRYDYVLTRSKGTTMRVQVRIVDVLFVSNAWTYRVVGLDEQEFEWVNHEYLVYVTDKGAPSLPPPRFLSVVGSTDYPLMTTSWADGLLANTRVRIGYPWYDGKQWVYPVVSEDGRGVAAAAEPSLAFVVPTGITETPGVTPSPVFGSYTDMSEYNLMTSVDIGDIPAHTLVRIEELHYDGTKWVYILDTDGHTDGLPMRRLSATAEQLTYISSLTLTPESNTRDG